MSPLIRATALVTLIALSSPSPAYLPLSASALRPSSESAATGLESALQSPPAGPEDSQQIVEQLQTLPTSLDEQINRLAEFLEDPYRNLLPKMLAQMPGDLFDAVVRVVRFVPELREETESFLLRDLDPNNPADCVTAEQIARLAMRWEADPDDGRYILAMLDSVLSEEDLAPLRRERGQPPHPLSMTEQQLLNTIQALPYGRLSESIAVEGMFRPLYIVGDHDRAYPVVREEQQTERVSRRGLVVVNWDHTGHHDGANLKTISEFQRELSSDPDQQAEFQRLAASSDRTAGWEIRDRWLHLGDFLKGLALDGSAAEIIHVVAPDDRQKELDETITNMVGNPVRIRRMKAAQLLERLKQLPEETGWIQSVDLDHFLWVTQGENEENVDRAGALRAFLETEDEIARLQKLPQMNIVALSSPTYVDPDIAPGLLRDVLEGLKKQDAAGMEETTRVILQTHPRFPGGPWLRASVFQKMLQNVFPAGFHLVGSAVACQTDDGWIPLDRVGDIDLLLSQENSPDIEFFKANWPQGWRPLRVTNSYRTRTPTIQIAISGREAPLGIHLHMWEEPYEDNQERMVRHIMTSPVSGIRLASLLMGAAIIKDEVVYRSDLGKLIRRFLFVLHHRNPTLHRIWCDAYLEISPDPDEEKTLRPLADRMLNDPGLRIILGLDDRAGLEEPTMAWKKLYKSDLEIDPTRVLIFTEPETFDLAVLAARWGQAVAIVSNGPEAGKLKTLLVELERQQLIRARYFIGIDRSTNFLSGFTEQIQVTLDNRPKILVQLGLQSDDLPRLVADTLEATRRYFSARSSIDLAA